MVLGKARAGQAQGLISVMHLWLAANLVTVLDLNFAEQHQALQAELELCAWMLLAWLCTAISAGWARQHRAEQGTAEADTGEHVSKLAAATEAFGAAVALDAVLEDIKKAQCFTEEYQHRRQVLPLPLYCHCFFCSASSNLAAQPRTKCPAFLALKKLTH